MPRKRDTRAFTLIELLVVLAIMGLLAAMTLPNLGGFGRSNATSASIRQLLDDVALARQRALNDRTDVYVVFSVRTTANWFEFTSKWPQLLPAQRQQFAEPFTNIFTRQYTGYALYAARSVGDQPGRPTPRYLTPWRELPDGAFIPTWKFLQMKPEDRELVTDDVVRPLATNGFPVPTARSPLIMSLPYLAFNSRGQVISEPVSGNYHDVVIPLARGSIFYDPDLTPDPQESPLGNSTNINTFNHIRVDWLTGRARAERRELQ